MHFESSLRHSFVSAYFLLRTTLVGLLFARIPLRCSDKAKIRQQVK